MLRNINLFLNKFVLAYFENIIPIRPDSKLISNNTFEKSRRERKILNDGEYAIFLYKQKYGCASTLQPNQLAIRKSY